MLSNKCKYAIRSVLFLAVESSQENKFSAKEIASELKIPLPFLGKILQDLVRKKLISSTKGPKGGFYLNENNLNGSIIDIIEVIDGLSFFTSCTLGLLNCSDSAPCPIHEEFKACRSNIENLFRSKTVKEISKDIESTFTYLVN